MTIEPTNNNEPADDVEPVVGEVLARRRFLLDADGILRGLFVNAPVADGVNVAQCSRGHRAPGKWCQCGFYAFLQPDLHVDVDPGIQVVDAVVALSGLVRVHDYGVRAEKLRLVAVAGDVDEIQQSQLADHYPAAHQYRDAAAMLADHRLSSEIAPAQDTPPGLLADLRASVADRDWDEVRYLVDERIRDLGHRAYTAAANSRPLHWLGRGFGAALSLFLAGVLAYLLGPAVALLMILLVFSCSVGRVLPVLALIGLAGFGRPLFTQAWLIGIPGGYPIPPWMGYLPRATISPDHASDLGFSLAVVTGVLCGVVILQRIWVSRLPQRTRDHSGPQPLPAEAFGAAANWEVTVEGAGGAALPGIRTTIITPHNPSDHPYDNPSKEDHHG